MKSADSLLETAVHGLLAHGAAHPASGLIDLSGWLCVVRGGRAGRLLLHELLTVAAAECRRVIPPYILTQGRMVERLLDAGAPIAQPMERTLAWIKALSAMPSESLRPLAPEPPARADWVGWHRLATLIDALHEELEGAGATMLGAAAHADAMDQPAEAERWRVLAEAQERYRAALRGAGLVDPHEWRWSVANRGQLERSELIGAALIGVVELNAIQRAALAAANVPIEAFVHADESVREAFDAFGCVVPAFWRGRAIPLDGVDLVVADRPAEQAQAALRAVAALKGEFAAEDIVIGLGDETLREEIERAAMWAEVTVHPAQGDPLRLRPAARLLSAVADYLDDPRFAHVATMLRHADVERWLARTLPGEAGRITPWLGLLDHYFADHLQQRFAGRYLGDPAQAAQMRAVHDALQQLLAPLGAKAVERPITQWLEPIATVLASVYGASEARRDDVPEWIKALASASGVPAPLDVMLAAPAAIRLLLRELGERAVPAEPRHASIEILGWLELSADPSLVHIIAGVNDGKIPATIAPDPFLPDSMRRALGLSCNESRYGRDAYVLDTMIRSGRRLTLITGRRNASGEPLTPSRLLLACAGRELAARVQRLCSEAPMPSLPIGAPPPRAVSQFVVPALPEPMPVFESMNVTDFRLYIACPYRFALARLLRLEPMTDRVSELDPIQFGNVAHDVLRRFGEHEAVRESMNAGEIRAFLLGALADQVAQQFGEVPLPAVQVQQAQLAQRLGDFATAQANMRREGWQIRYTERSLGEEAMLEVPGEAPIRIRGKIDRIDQHEKTGAWRIIDYKSGDTATSPIKAHHGSEKLPAVEATEWIDLQLPLYHDFATRAGLGIERDIALGFLVLPRKTGGAKWIDAAWTDDHLRHAIREAQRIVRAIRRGEFAMNPLAGSTFDPFARICQSMVFTSADEVMADMDLEAVK